MQAVLSPRGTAYMQNFLSSPDYVNATRSWRFEAFTARWKLDLWLSNKFLEQLFYLLKLICHFFTSIQY